jgi:type I restriction enzyme S subunit
MTQEAVDISAMVSDGAPPRGWKSLPFADVVDILDSKRVPINSKERSDRVGDVPYYGATGQVGVIDTHIFDEELVLLGEDGAPFLDPAKPKAYLIRGKAWVNNHAHVLRGKPGLLNSFLLYQLNAVDYGPYVSGTTRLKLPQGPMKQIPLLVPPLQEQVAIVAEIEKQFTRLDAGVAALRRVQANLKRYRAAVLKAACEGRLVPTEAELARKEGRTFETGQALIGRILEGRRTATAGRGRYNEPRAPDVSKLSLPPGWGCATVEQLTSLVTSGSRGWGGYYSESGPLFIRAQDIKTDSLNLNSVARVSLPEKAEGMRASVESNDLLITITGANVTKSALVRGLMEQAFVSQHVALLKPVFRDTAAFQFLWIVSPAHGRHVLEDWAYGAGKPGLSLVQLRSLLIGIPPKAEQERIVAEVERRLSVVEGLEAAVTANLQRATRLRQSVLRDAFQRRE